MAFFKLYQVPVFGDPNHSDGADRSKVVRWQGGPNRRRRRRCAEEKITNVVVSGVENRLVQRRRRLRTAAERQTSLDVLLRMEEGDDGGFCGTLRKL